jgi:hypothetical protein
MERNMQRFVDWTRDNWGIVVVFLATVAGGLIAVFLIPESIAKFYHVFVPVYETKLTLDGTGSSNGPVVVNADQGLFASARATSNGAEYDIFRCSWQLDGLVLDEHNCGRWYLRPGDPSAQLDLSKNVHEISVTPEHGFWLWKPPASEPRQFQVRPFATPKVEIRSPDEPTLYLGETAKIAYSARDPKAPAPWQCTWLPVDAGAVKPADADSCVGEYRAPDRLKKPPEPFDVDISAAAVMGKWPNVKAEPLKMHVVAPQEHVYHYVLETSTRMQPPLFEAARKRILDDLAGLKARSGYLGLISFGGPAGCMLEKASIPLGPIDLDAAPKTIGALAVGAPDAAPLTAAWARAIDEYDRFKRDRNLQDPRYWLVTLVAGNDSCRPTNPAGQLRILNGTIAGKNFQNDWRLNRLITFTIVTKDLALWRPALGSSEYRDGNAILVLSDDADVIQSVLNSLANLNSPSKAEVDRACRNLVTRVAANSDERGQARMAAVCRTISPRTR